VPTTIDDSLTVTLGGAGVGTDVLDVLDELDELSVPALPPPPQAVSIAAHAALIAVQIQPDLAKP
jgi:hypothetical protein